MYEKPHSEDVKIEYVAIITIKQPRYSFHPSLVFLAKLQAIGHATYEKQFQLFPLILIINSLLL